MRYSDKLMDHFLDPRNAGEIPDADGIGTVGDPECGDFMKVWIKVDGNLIVDVKFKCKGCPAAIAVGSMVTELAVGKDLDEAMELTDDDIADALGGLPEPKQHCSNLGAAALHEAIDDHVLRFVRGETPRIEDPQSGCASPR